MSLTFDPRAAIAHLSSVDEVMSDLITRVCFVLNVRNGSIMTDLTNPRWIIAKGILFAVMVVMAGTGVIFYDDPWYELGLLLICLWAACRFYYFLFYVLERYVGVEGRYAGILDLLKRLRSRPR